MKRKDISGLLMMLLTVSILAVSCVESEHKEPPVTASSDSIPAKISKTRIEVLDTEALAFIDTSAKVEELAGGYHWTEGPLYIANGDYFIFSDVPANKVFKWKDGEGVSPYLDSSGYTGSVPKEKEPGSNGLTLDPKGRLVLTQQGNRRVARMLAPLSKPSPKYESLVNKYQGKKLNSPNDLVFKSNGDLYFTDPPYGLDHGDEDSTKEMSFHGVFRVKPNGKVDVVTKEFRFPNGLALTPDEKFLLVAHSDADNMVWMKYELGKDGLVKNKSVFYKVPDADKKDPGSPDGFKINRKGYVFSSGPGGVWIFNPSGKPIARIYTGELASNCALSSDEKTLFITCDDYIKKVRLR